MASSIAGRNAKVFFAKIITSDFPKALRICIDQYAMDKRLTMYFKEKSEFYACDKLKEESCAEGDYVMVREIPEIPCEGRMIQYAIEKVVYKRGHIIDPISGKRNAGIEYIDDINRICKLFGRTRPYHES